MSVVEKVSVLKPGVYILLTLTLCSLGSRMVGRGQNGGRTKVPFLGLGQQ